MGTQGPGGLSCCWMGEKGRKEGWEERGEKRKKRKGMKGRVKERRERDEETDHSSKQDLRNLSRDGGGRVDGGRH